MTNKFDSSFWENKYVNKATRWDIGYISTPLKTYFDQLNDKNISILIPGAGNSYEAEYLYKSGFQNVSILDLASQPLENFSNRVSDFPKEQLIKDDFFNHKGSYDLIIEQTFFCALDPALRKNYVHKMLELLTENGALVGLFFDFPLTEEGPPFGGSKEEYVSLFSNNFIIKVLETAHNSIKERATKELFAIFEKR
jgi:thiopurine S-methyltransferase